MSDLYSRSLIKAGGTAPFSTTSSAALFQSYTHKVKIVDGIAAGAAATVIFNWGGPHDIIDAVIVAMSGPNGEQITNGAVAQNTHPILTFPQNSLGKKSIALQIPAAGAVLPANGFIYLEVWTGSDTKLDLIDGA